MVSSILMIIMICGQLYFQLTQSVSYGKKGINTHILLHPLFHLSFALSLPNEF